MAFIAPVQVPPQAKGLMGLEPRFQQRPGSMVDTQSDTYLPEGMLGQGIAGLKQAIEKVTSAFSAPGTEALMGGPMMVRPFFHGTTAPAAESILRDGFNLSNFGKGADALPSASKMPQPGWYGKGVYFGNAAPLKFKQGWDAETYAEKVAKSQQTKPAVLKAMIDDDHILDLSRHEKFEKLLPELNDFAGVEDFSKLPGKQQAEWMEKFAQAKGYQGMTPNYHETVIYDPSIIQKVEPYK